MGCLTAGLLSRQAERYVVSHGLQFPLAVLPFFLVIAVIGLSFYLLGKILNRRLVSHSRNRLNDLMMKRDKLLEDSKRRTEQS